MLACGTVCQPSEVRREIQLFESSTRPARVATDVGDGFIKGVGNPQGTTSLVSELIAAELGTWMGLQIPPFAILNHCDIEIPMLGHHGLIQPPIFFSSAVDGTPRDAGRTFISLLQNPADVAKLVVFDTWIRNCDRYVDGNPNSDNLIYAPMNKGRRYSLVPIDHSHCFVDVDFETDLPSNDLVTDGQVYGLYPEFRPFITTEFASQAVATLRRLHRDFVQECVNSVPAQWGLSHQSRVHLTDLICARAAFVVETILVKIVEEPDLPGIVG